MIVTKLARNTTKQSISTLFSTISSIARQEAILIVTILKSNLIAYKSYFKIKQIMLKLVIITVHFSANM